jgi:hypothetical protein
MPLNRMTIYLDTMTIEDDADTFRCTISDRKGNEVEVIACPPRFVSAMKDAQKFWEAFQRKHAEAHITSLPRRRKAGA